MESKEKKKKILIGIADSPNSRIASNYVREILGGKEREFEVVLFHVIPKAKSEEEAKLRRISEREGLKIIKETLQEIKNDFVNSGISPGSIRIVVEEGKHETVAEGILDYLEKEHFQTVVVGRRGIARSEEFLFGSVSKKIVSEAKGCAVWVVEPPL
ncbi:MAG: universal stress protein [Nitrospinae bacterium]|nr:universal stress protein [Nitrospinota bacterium]